MSSNMPRPQHLFLPLRVTRIICKSETIFGVHQRAAWWRSNSFLECWQPSLGLRSPARCPKPIDPWGRGYRKSVYSLSFSHSCVRISTIRLCTRCNVLVMISVGSQIYQTSEEAHSYSVSTVMTPRYLDGRSRIYLKLTALSHTYIQRQVGQVWKLPLFPPSTLNKCSQTTSSRPWTPTSGRVHTNRLFSKVQ